MTSPVRVIFLGGLGEIGRNCLCLEIDGRLLIDDCGLMFPTEDMPGVDLVLPDLSYLQDRADDIEAVVLTHGHEDHIGALPYLLKGIGPLPVYGSALTLGILRSKLEEGRVTKNAELHEIGPGDRFEAGPFDVEAFSVTHSTPHAMGLVFRTPQGVIIHTGDFKIDQTPVDGRLTDLSSLGRFGTEGVRLLLSDSTNAETPGITASERQVGDWLVDIFGRHRSRRIIAACFASHLHRVQQICDAAVGERRKIAFLGRSMVNNTTLARSMGVLSVPDSSVIDIADVDDLDPKTVCVVCTGSQGEPLAALSLMAAGEHRFVKVGEGDTVVISASPIPGNEMNVHRAIDGLTRSGAEVVHSGIAKVHVSGHAAAEELKTMIALTRPESFVPVHGEYRHLMAHAKLAWSVGVSEDHVLIAEDGDIVEMTEEGVYFAEDEVPAGYVYVDGSGIGDVTGGVLRDRRRLADDGTMVCVVGVDAQTGEVVRGPEILSRGFLAEFDEEKFNAEAAERIIASIEEAAAEDALDLTTLNRHVRQTLSRFANKQTGRKPIVFPIVIEV